MRPCGIITSRGLEHATGLIELNASKNPAITTTAPFAASLVRLNITGYQSGLGDAGLRHATSLRYLTASNNPRVTTIAPFVATLQELDVSWGCGVSKEHLAAVGPTTRLDALHYVGNERMNDPDDPRFGECVVA